MVTSGSSPQSSAEEGSTPRGSAFTGKVAVITGASRGLGAGLARYFHGKGLRLGLCARARAELQPAQDIIVAPLDVTDEEAVDAFSRRVVDRFGGIDLWINNAGVLEPIAPLRDVSSHDFRRAIDVNLMGVFHGTRAFVHHVRQRGTGGVLVNISSGAARNGYAGWSAYCASKAAVDLLTECVQLEERDLGLRAYSIAPGIIDTDMQKTIRGTPADQFPMVEKFRQLKAENAFSSPEWVARHLLEIAFDEAHRPTSVRIGLPPERSS